MVHGNSIAEGDISNTLNKILGGDAKFINIKGELPKLVSSFKEATK